MSKNNGIDWEDVGCAVLFGLPLAALMIGLAVRAFGWASGLY